MVLGENWSYASRVICMFIILKTLISIIFFNTLRPHSPSYTKTDETTEEDTISFEPYCMPSHVRNRNLMRL